MPKEFRFGHLAVSYLLRASPVATLVISCLWAPPVVTQFSVVGAPPVPTFVISFQFIASFLWAPPLATQFSVRRRAFVKFGHCQWRPVYIHIAFDFVAFLWAPPVATQFSAIGDPFTHCN